MTATPIEGVDAVAPAVGDTVETVDITGVVTEVGDGTVTLDGPDGPVEVALADVVTVTPGADFEAIVADDLGMDGLAVADPVAAVVVEPGSPEQRILQAISDHYEQMSVEIGDFESANKDSALAAELAAWKATADAFVEDAAPRLNPEAPTAADALVASVASQTLLAPPDEWFEPFDLGGPTPITITADGRVYGHLADWKSCHRNPALQAAGQCVRPPSDPNPAFFYSGGQVLTASGALIDVGRLTVGGGHADVRLGLVAALEHYDDASSVGAVVHVHEDAHGIGVFGSIVADASPQQVAAMRRSPFSGDWRKERGRYRLVAAHAVNTGGYPIPRGTLVASVTESAFVATGRVGCTDGCEEDGPVEAALPPSLVASVFDMVEAEISAGLAEMKTSLFANFDLEG